jgi:hypothetical protein
MDLWTVLHICFISQYNSFSPEFATCTILTSIHSALVCLETAPKARVLQCKSTNLKEATDKIEGMSERRMKQE